MAFLQFGKIILTTSVGIMDHEEARRKKMGGKVSKYGIPKSHAVQLDSCSSYVH